MHTPLSYSEDGNVVTIYLPKLCTYAVYEDLKKAYGNNDILTHYTLDFIRVTYIDSSFLGLLLLLKEHTGGMPSKIKLVNLNPEMTEILKTAQFGTIFNIE
jgi:HptB-dependent secretion and biofilm anti anti-sigma factor